MRERPSFEGWRTWPVGLMVRAPAAPSPRGESAGAEGAGPRLGQEWASPAPDRFPSRHWDSGAGRGTVVGAFGGAKAGLAPHHSCPSTCRGQPRKPARQETVRFTSAHDRRSPPGRRRVDGAVRVWRCIRPRQSGQIPCETGAPSYGGVGRDSGGTHSSRSAQRPHQAQQSCTVSAGCAVRRLTLGPRL
jgi:hypothetical protein